MSQDIQTTKRKAGMSIRSKFLLMLLGISIFSISIIGFQGSYNGYQSLTDGIKQQLSILRTSRAKQLENYFKERMKQVEMLADSTMIINAVDEFSSAFTLLESYDVGLDKKQQVQLEDFYNDKFMPRLPRDGNTDELLNASNYLPRSLAGQYLQYHYIATNPHKLSEKDAVNDARDESYFSTVHKKYHPKLRKFTKKFDYYDLFLIDKNTKNIIYSTYKKTDFATNLGSDIQAQTSLASVVNEVIRNPRKGAVSVVDLKPYISSYNKPAAFFATPIFDGNKFIGILALQTSIDQINTLVNAQQSWLESGLGETGDVYLVGSDYKMRSDSRFLSRGNKLEFIKSLEEAGGKEETIKKIANANSTILLQPVETTTSKAALAGKTGIEVTTNYQKHQVLSAYQPIKVAGLSWAILAEIDEDEATKPIVDFQKHLLISAAIQAALISFFSLWLASRFINPIKKLIEGARRANEGDTTTKIDLQRQDEFGKLADSFNDMVSNIESRKETIIEKDKSINKLLNNAFPSNIAQRYINGEKNIADSFSNVAILYTALKGLDDSVNGLNATDAVARLNQIIDAFDEAAQAYDIERITTIGDSYLAVCGLSNPRLDYAHRCVDYGLALFDIIDRFNIQYGTDYKLRIGVSAGDINAGVIGNYKAVYDLWGETLNIASRIRYTAELGGMRISESVHNQLTSRDEFKACATINMRGVGDISTWEYTHITTTRHDSNDNTVKTTPQVSATKG
jgi:class 3 adenylate cyclase